MTKPFQGEEEKDLESHGNMKTYLYLEEGSFSPKHYNTLPYIGKNTREFSKLVNYNKTIDITVNSVNEQHPIRHYLLQCYYQSHFRTLFAIVKTLCVVHACPVYRYARSLSKISLFDEVKSSALCSWANYSFNALLISRAAKTVSKLSSVTLTFLFLLFGQEALDSLLGTCKTLDSPLGI